VSNLEAAAELAVCDGPALATEPVFELVESRPVVLTPRRWTDADGAAAEDELTVLRYLPGKGRRMVGAWCFLDYYGPAVISADVGMQVPPHPHCGLQTISWLLSGAIQHTDSLGSDVVLRPGQLGLMTAGHGIAHAERSPDQRPPVLHGVQLWVALPESVREGLPAFDHVAEPPKLTLDGVSATVILGEFGGVAASAPVHTPIVGADIDLPGNALSTLKLRPDWEYAVLVTRGSAEIEGQLMHPAAMAYLGCGRSELTMQSELGGRVLLIGGEPFGEELVMWWNFVARSHDEIVVAREEWMEGQRFGAVSDSEGPLAAPPIPPVRLKPRGRS
jgi:redox-sensitive bicupin YhaK (pirin superfamily)